MNKHTALVLCPPIWPFSPPLGIASIKSFLKANSIDAKVFDLNNSFYGKIGHILKEQWACGCNSAFEDSLYDYLGKSWPKEFNRSINALSSYDLIGFSCHRSNFNFTIKLATKLRETTPDTKIIFGGPEIARQYFIFGEELANKFSSLADKLIIGEGELPLLSYITKPSDHNILSLFEELPGDFLTAPDYSDTLFTNYKKSGSAPIVFSRGCVRKCSFCSERLLYRSYRTTPVEKLISCMTELKNKGIEGFIFYDSMINGNLPAFEDLLDNIISSFGSVPWEAQIAVRNDMPGRIFEKIKNSGCYNLFIGLESGSAKVLKTMKKNFSPTDAEMFFQNLKEHNLNFGISLIAGFPGETEADFQDTLDFLDRNKGNIRKIEQVNPFVFYEGTELDILSDYRYNREPIMRTSALIEFLKKNGFKYTNKFVNNLIQK